MVRLTFVVVCLSVVYMQQMYLGYEVGVGETFYTNS